MLAKQYRLNLSKAGNRVIFKHKIKNKPWSDYYLIKNDCGHLRAAVVVPVKQVKSAAKRNKIRRKIYQLLQEQNAKAASFDLLVVYQQSQIKPDIEEKIKKDIQEIFKQY